MEYGGNERTNSQKREREKKKKGPKGIISKLNCVPKEHLKIFGN